MLEDARRGWNVKKCGFSARVEVFFGMIEAGKKAARGSTFSHRWTGGRADRGRGRLEAHKMTVDFSHF